MADSCGSGQSCEGASPESEVLAERIREKIADYNYYRFTVRQTRALNIFFDLAQEYEDLSYLYHLPVQVLEFFFPVTAVLYARDESGVFVAQTPNSGPQLAMPPVADIAASPCAADQWWVFSVKGRPGGGMPYQAGGIPLERVAHRDEQEVLAILAILPESPLTEHDKLFYEKFANRLGFSLHNRLLALKNLEHIEFVRTLVHDIGHNVITPNLHFKLLMRQMAEKIDALRRFSDTLAPTESGTIASLRDLCDRIEAHHQEISSHFHQSSFFLETLLRQSHFDQGHYVLQRTTFNLTARVVAPQMERYRTRLEERDVTVEERYEADARAFTVNGDMGLLSQVMANFLSNAVKYTRETPGREGRLVRCEVRALPGHFGEHGDGVIVELLSSGAAIPCKEADRLFSENFRASNACEEYGTGHGLYFSRLIIRQHGGEYGHRRTEEGNVFYLILPCVRSGGADVRRDKGEAKPILTDNDASRTERAC